MRNGLPLTTPTRTIADLAQAGASEEIIHQAIQEALRRSLATHQELLAKAYHRRGRTAQMLQKAADTSHGK